MLNKLLKVSCIVFLIMASAEMGALLFAQIVTYMGIVTFVLN